MKMAFRPVKMKDKQVGFALLERFSHVLVQRLQDTKCCVVGDLHIKTRVWMSNWHMNTILYYSTHSMIW